MRRFVVVLLLGCLGCEGTIIGGHRTSPPSTDGAPRTDCSQPAPAGMPLLWRVTASQYRNLATALAKGRAPSVTMPPTSVPVGEVPFSGEPSLGRYSGQPAGATVQETDLQLLLDASLTAGTQAVAALKRQSGHCIQRTYAGGFVACARQTLLERATVVQGRTLDPSTLDAMVRELTATQPTLSNDEAMALGLSMVLASPGALFRRELSATLSGEEIATAIAFSLTDAPPDEPLWAAAIAGELQTDEGRAAQLARLLEEPARLPGLKRFLVEHFRLMETRAVAKDQSKFPFHNANALVADTDRLITSLLQTATTQRFLEQVLTTRVAFVTRSTALSYGLAPASLMASSNDAPVQVELGPERAGLLTQPSLLSGLSHTDDTDPVKRGHFVSESLLCVKVPPLPIGVVPTLPDLGPGATPRDRLRVHSQGTCWGCHQLMDPIGLGMEDFDHLGRAQTRDASGQLVGTGSPLDQGFTGTADLAAKLAAAPLVHACVAQHLHAFFSGGQPLQGDRCTAQAAAEASLAAGGDVRPVIEAYFSSPTFLTRQETP